MAKEANTEILAIDLAAFKQIITQTQLVNAEQKIEFLLRYGPAFRDLGTDGMQRLEVHFRKVEYDRGY
jgi:hypothetical protein